MDASGVMHWLEERSVDPEVSLVILGLLFVSGDGSVEERVERQLYTEAEIVRESERSDCGHYPLVEHNRILRQAREVVAEIRREFGESL